MRRLIRSIAGCQHRRVGRVALLDVVVDDDAVFVVDELRLVAELDRLAEAALDDRTGIGVVQRHHPRRTRRGLTGEALAGLGGDLAGQRGGPFQLGDRRPGPSGRLVTEGAQLAASVAHHRVGLPGDPLGDRRPAQR